MAGRGKSALLHFFKRNMMMHSNSNSTNSVTLAVLKNNFQRGFVKFPSCGRIMWPWCGCWLHMELLWNNERHEVCRNIDFWRPTRVSQLVYWPRKGDQRLHVSKELHHSYPSMHWGQFLAAALKLVATTWWYFCLKYCFLAFQKCYGLWCHRQKGLLSLEFGGRSYQPFAFR